jgi:hypothetical protein
MTNPNEKFIVRVIRKRELENPTGNKNEQVDQIYEQEFDKLDIGKFAVDLNKKDGQEKDAKSLKLGERDNIPPLRTEKE